MTGSTASPDDHKDPNSEFSSLDEKFREKHGINPEKVFKPGQILDLDWRLIQTARKLDISTEECKSLWVQYCQHRGVSAARQKF